MKVYAVTDSTGAVLRIVCQDVAPKEGGVELPADTPMSWPKAPYEGAALVVSDSALSWRDDRTLQEARAQAWARIKAARTAAIESPKRTSVGRFDATAEARASLSREIERLRIAAARGGDRTTSFTTADNERRPFALEELETAALEIGEQIKAAHDAGHELRMRIAGAGLADLGGINWPTR